jgi:50S ribosomal protein L16 3-hydroxylase
MLEILDVLPTTQEFFHKFWNKKPFVVRDMIPKEIIGALIDGDHLAGISMEEEVKSRLVTKGESQFDWTCGHGPFEEKDFAELGEEDWSLLVQNTDQYHADTAELLKCFNFTPRWLLDDIMVSFSSKGGTVGPHTDSYHVFLVQGKGKRHWKVANEAIKTESCIEDLPLKLLKKSFFEGEDITVTEGDVIYIPPHFAHQGISLQPSLTYSVGFLGPTLSEMLIEFGHYIEEHHLEIPRYLGQNLTESAVPFHVTSEHIDDLRFFLTSVFNQDYFTKWLTHYFCSPVQIYDDENTDEFDNVKDITAGNVMLIKHPAIKIMFTPLKIPQTYSISAGDLSFELDFSDLFLVNIMAQEAPFPANIFTNHTEILKNLLARNILKIAK